MPDSWIDKKEFEELVGSLPSSKKGRRKKKAPPRANSMQLGIERGLPEASDMHPAAEFAGGLEGEPPSPEAASEEREKKGQIGEDAHAHAGALEAIPEPRDISEMTALEAIWAEPQAAAIHGGELLFPESIFELDLQEEIEDDDSTGPDLDEVLDASVAAIEPGMPEMASEPSASETFLKTPICPDEIEEPLIVESLDLPEEQRRIPDFLEDNEEAEPVRLTPTERDADRAFLALADARAKADLGGLLRSRGVTRVKQGCDGASPEPVDSEGTVAANGHAEGKGTALLPETVEADEDTKTSLGAFEDDEIASPLPEPVEDDEIASPVPEALEDDEIASPLPETVEDDEIASPLPEPFDDDEIASPVPETVEDDEIASPLPEPFDDDELAPPLPEALDGDELAAPLPESFDDDELAPPLPEALDGDELAAPLPESVDDDEFAALLPEAVDDDEGVGDPAEFGILVAWYEESIGEKYEFEVGLKVSDREALCDRIFRLGEQARLELDASGVVICDEHGLPLYTSNEEDGRAAPPAALLLELSSRANESLGLGRDGVIQIADGEGGWRCLLPSQGGVRPLYAGLSLDRPLEHGEIDRWSKALAAAAHPIPSPG